MQLDSKVQLDSTTLTDPPHIWPFLGEFASTAYPVTQEKEKPYMHLGVLLGTY
jgi:hypothetical protein